MKNLLTYAVALPCFCCMVIFFGITLVLFKTTVFLLKIPDKTVNKIFVLRTVRREKRLVQKRKQMVQRKLAA